MNTFLLPSDADFHRAVRRAFLLPLVMMGLLALLLSWLVGHLFSLAARVDHTEQVVAQSHASEKLVVNMESGVRGFQVTGERRFLEPYTQSRPEVEAALNRLEELVSDNPPQSAQVKTIRAALETWQRLAQDMILRRESGTGYQEPLINAQGKAAMDSLRGNFAAFRQVEAQLREARAADLQNLRRFVLTARWLLALVYALVIGWFVRREMRRVAAGYQQAFTHVARERAALEASQEELHQQREWYRVTLSSIGDAVIAADAEGKVTFLNPVAETLTGWKSSESLGQPLQNVFRIVNERTREPAENPVFKVLREGNVVGLANHTALISRQGTETSIEDSAAPIKDARGNITGAVMVFHDVTESRSAHEALRRSKEELASFFENATMGLHWVGSDGIIQWANRAELEMLGYTKEEYIGRHIVEFHEDKKSITSILDRLTRGEKICEHEARMKCKDGSVRIVSISSSVLWDDQKRFLHTQCFTVDITERRALERALAQSEAHHRCIAELTSDFTFTALVTEDSQIVLVSASTGFVKTTGYTVDQLNAAGGWPTLIHPDDLPLAHNSTSGLIAGREDTREIRLQRADGVTYWLRYHARPECDAEGRVVLIHGAGTDITERRQAEELRVRLASVVESSDDAIVSKTLEGVVTTWNQGAERIFGYSAADIIGQNISLLIPSDRQDEEPCILARLQKGERIEHFETTRRRKDGAIIDVSLTISPLRDDSGRMIGASKIARDISERKRAETAVIRLQAAEKARRLELESLMEAAPAIVWIAHDPECHQITGNRAAAEFLRIPRGQDQSKTGQGSQNLAHIQVVRDGRPLRNHELPMQVVAGSGKPIWSVELEIHFGEESIAWLFGNVVPLLHETGEPRGAMGIFVDITARKRAAEALGEAKEQLARHAVELERTVAERTLQLREANDQLEEFIYSIAHDLRQPVRAMEGFSEILLENHATTISASGRDYLRQINQSAQFMDKLLLDLLAYGRAARAPLELEPLSVQQIWHAAQLQCSQEIQKTGAHIETIHPLPLVLAHETSLAQILINLLANALRFTSPGVKPHVKFSATEHAGFMRLNLEDNGIGIAPEHHERIFRVFERLGGTRYEGTGIGLSIVRKAAERMGGRVGVASEPGRGSCFWVELRKARDLR